MSPPRSILTQAELEERIRALSSRRRAATDTTAQNPEGAFCVEIGGQA